MDIGSHFKTFFKKYFPTDETSVLFQPVKTNVRVQYKNNEPERARSIVYEDSGFYNGKNNRKRQDIDGERFYPQFHRERREIEEPSLLIKKSSSLTIRKSTNRKRRTNALIQERPINNSLSQIRSWNSIVERRDCYKTYEEVKGDPVRDLWMKPSVGVYNVHTEQTSEKTESKYRVESELQYVVALPTEKRKKKTKEKYFTSKYSPEIIETDPRGRKQKVTKTRTTGRLASSSSGEIPWRPIHSTHRRHHHKKKWEVPDEEIVPSEKHPSKKEKKPRSREKYLESPKKERAPSGSSDEISIPTTHITHIKHHHKKKWNVPEEEPLPFKGRHSSLKDRELERPRKESSPSSSSEDLSPPTTHKTHVKHHHKKKYHVTDEKAKPFKKPSGEYRAAKQSELESSEEESITSDSNGDAPPFSKHITHLKRHNKRKWDASDKKGMPYIKPSGKEERKYLTKTRRELSPSEENSVTSGDVPSISKHTTHLKRHHKKNLNTTDKEVKSFRKLPGKGKNLDLKESELESRGDKSVTSASSADSLYPPKHITHLKRHHKKKLDEPERRELSPRKSAEKVERGSRTPEMKELESSNSSSDSSKYDHKNDWDRPKGKTLSSDKFPGRKSRRLKEKSIEFPDEKERLDRLSNEIPHRPPQLIDTEYHHKKKWVALKEKALSKDKLTGKKELEPRELKRKQSKPLEKNYLSSISSSEKKPYQPQSSETILQQDKPYIKKRSKPSGKRLTISKLFDKRESKPSELEGNLSIAEKTSSTKDYEPRELELEKLGSQEGGLFNRLSSRKKYSQPQPLPYERGISLPMKGKELRPQGKESFISVVSIEEIPTKASSLDPRKNIDVESGKPYIKKRSNPSELQEKITPIQKLIGKKESKPSELEENVPLAEKTLSIKGSEPEYLELKEIRPQEKGILNTLSRKKKSSQPQPLPSERGISLPMKGKELRPQGKESFISVVSIEEILTTAPPLPPRKHISGGLEKSSTKKGSKPSELLAKTVPVEKLFGKKASKPSELTKQDIKELGTQEKISLVSVVSYEEIPAQPLPQSAMDRKGSIPIARKELGPKEKVSFISVVSTEEITTQAPPDSTGKSLAEREWKPSAVKRKELGSREKESFISVEDYLTPIKPVKTGDKNESEPDALKGTTLGPREKESFRSSSSSGSTSSESSFSDQRKKKNFFGFNLARRFFNRKSSPSPRKSSKPYTYKEESDRSQGGMGSNKRELNSLKAKELGRREKESFTSGTAKPTAGGKSQKYSAMKGKELGPKGKESFMSVVSYEEVDTPISGIKHGDKKGWGSKEIKGKELGAREKEYFSSSAMKGKTLGPKEKESFISVVSYEEVNTPISGIKHGDKKDWGSKEIKGKELGAREREYFSSSAMKGKELGPKEKESFVSVVSYEEVNTPISGIKHGDKKGWGSKEIKGKELGAREKEYFSSSAMKGKTLGPKEKESFISVVSYEEVNTPISGIKHGDKKDWGSKEIKGKELGAREKEYFSSSAMKGKELRPKEKESFISVVSYEEVNTPISGIKHGDKKDWGSKEIKGKELGAREKEYFSSSAVKGKELGPKEKESFISVVSYEEVDTPVKQIRQGGKKEWEPKALKGKELGAREKESFSSSSSSSASLKKSRGLKGRTKGKK